MKRLGPILGILIIAIVCVVVAGGLFVWSQRSRATQVAAEPTAAPTATARAATAARTTPTAAAATNPQTARIPAATATAAKIVAAYVAEGPYYRLYFSKPFYPEKADDRFGGIAADLIRDLDGAQKSIDIASFEIDLDPVVDALIRAAQRGVTVRVATDSENYETPDDPAGVLRRLKDGGVQVSLENAAGFMHNKFYNIDDKVLWTGSWNLTVNDTYRNNNNTLRLTDAKLIANYKKRMDEFMAGRFHGAANKTVPNPTVTEADGVKIENYFSPTGGGKQAIQKRLEVAQKSIKVLAFSFTDDDQAKALLDKAKKGVKVQGVFEARNANGSGAEYPAFKNAGLDVLTDGNCYTMHHKVYIIDDKTVITGSYNFSSNADKDNDENLLIIDDPNLAKLYSQEFDRVYQQAKNPKCG
ncbi:MAG: phospholipase D-like domain-containing protein [Anaerolineae bacterium]